MTLKTLSVEGYLISEAGPLEAARFARLAAKYEAMLQQAKAKGNAASEDEADRLLALSVWPQVSACATPSISVDEWFRIPLETIRAVREATERLNPKWFVVAAAPEVVEKKTRPRHKRTMPA